MGTLSNRMEQLVTEIESLARSRRASLAEIRETTRAMLGEIASDVRAAKQLWSSGAEVRDFRPPTPKVRVPKFEARPAPPPPPAVKHQRTSEEEQLTGKEQVLQVLRTHRDGIRLVDIGNELGVEWRGLIPLTKALLEEGKAEKIDNLYYPVEKSAN